MRADKINLFMQLAGQEIAESFQFGDEEQRKLGAHLLLSEVLEYVIEGLGITPVVNGVQITDPESVQYEAGAANPDALEMVDGLADVAYTMYWNSSAFGIPLEQAFELVCDNNLQKFVQLSTWSEGERPLERQEWDCGQNISWPQEVVQVEIIQVKDVFFAVGKDTRGKVRKPSSYKSVDLAGLVPK